MHPSGVQFGLSRGLLQRRGEEILLSDQLVETISLQAQMHVQLGRPAIRGNFLVDITVRAAQDGLGNHYQGLWFAKTRSAFKRLKLAELDEESISHRNPLNNSLFGLTTAVQNGQVQGPCLLSSCCELARRHPISYIIGGTPYPI